MGYDLDVDPPVGPFQIAPSAQNQTKPDVSGNVVVWEQQNDIYACRLDGNLPPDGLEVCATGGTAVCTTEGTQSNPTVSGNVVVWVHDGTGIEQGIYRIDLEEQTPSITRLSPELPDTVHSSPAIQDNIVVWSAITEGDPVSQYCVLAANPVRYPGEHYVVSEYDNFLQSPTISDTFGPTICVWSTDRVWSLDPSISSRDIYGRRVDLGTEFESNDSVGIRPEHFVPFFEDQTLTLGSSIDTWDWDLGNGSHSYVQDPSNVQYTYSSENRGFFDVALTTTNQDGDEETVSKVGHVMLLADSYRALFDDTLETLTTHYWDDQQGKWLGSDMYDATFMAPRILYKLADDPSFTQDQRDEFQDKANRTIEYHLGLFLPFLGIDPDEIDPEGNNPQLILNAIETEWTHANILNRMDGCSDERLKEIFAGFACWIDGMLHYDGENQQWFQNQVVVRNAINAVLMCANWLQMDGPDHWMSDEEINPLLGYYGETFFYGGFLETCYRFRIAGPSVGMPIIQKLHVQWVGFTTWNILNTYWVEEQPEDPGILYYRKSGEDVYINDIYYDDEGNTERMIAWQNNPPMNGIAMMYTFSNNPFCRTKANTLMCTMDTQFWNPDDWNPFPPGERTLKLGYCWLPSFDAPLEPRADLADNVGLAWACVTMYNKLMALGLQTDADAYIERAQMVFDSILTKFDVESPDDELIGFLWKDVAESYPPRDLDRFIGIHDHYHNESGAYCRARNKCTGCNFALLNALYEFLNAQGQWP